MWSEEKGSLSVCLSLSPHIKKKRKLGKSGKEAPLCQPASQTSFFLSLSFLLTSKANMYANRHTHTQFETPGVAVDNQEKGRGGKIGRLYQNYRYSRTLTKWRQVGIGANFFFPCYVSEFPAWCHSGLTWQHQTSVHCFQLTEIPEFHRASTAKEIYERNWVGVEGKGWERSDWIMWRASVLPGRKVKMRLDFFFANLAGE